jgi:cell wall-associated NlpC family hydrolase
MGRLLRRGRQEGSSSVAVIAAVFLSLVLCLCIADTGFFLAARFQAQNAADASALAAAQETFGLFGTGRAPRAVASDLAGSNGASLERFEVSGCGGRVQVEVSVQPVSLLLRKLGVGGRAVSAKAAAEIDIGALLSSRGIWYTADPALLGRLRGLLSNIQPGDRAAASTMVALLALSHLGKPYVWGASGPYAFDCSGLVCFVYAQIGVGLPRVTYSQVHCGRPVHPAELSPGDLVFFRGNGHVGIYLGGGWYIHAPRTGDVVKISALSSRGDLSACRRIL